MSTIRYYRSKISELEDSIYQINGAIKCYAEASEKLQKIKGVTKCKEFENSLQSQIESLRKEISDMNSTIASYEYEIDRLIELQEQKKKETE